MIAIFLCLKSKFESFQPFFEIKNSLKHDRQVVNWHWKKDIYLIWILRGINFFSLLFLLLPIKFFQDGAQVDFTIFTLKDVVFDDSSIWVGLGLYIFSQVVLIIGEIQICFFRKSPTLAPWLSPAKNMVLGSFKLVLVCLAGVAVVSGVPFVAPNDFMNFTQRNVPGLIPFRIKVNR